MRIEKLFPQRSQTLAQLPAILSERKSGWLAGALLVSAGVKAGLLLVDRVPFNADEAVVALMARHILQGERPVFFYGQAYMGSLDAYLGAIAFTMFGEGVWVLRLVQLLLYLGTIWTTAALGKAVFGVREAGVIAAWLMAIPAVNVTLYTTATLGGYGELLLLGNLTLIVTLRIGKLLPASKPPPPKLWLVFGFLAGLGLWAFGLTLVYSLPAASFLVWRAWNARSIFEPARHRVPVALRTIPALRDKAVIWAGWAGWVAAGFIFGAAPWWSYALVNGFGSLISELAGSAIAGVDGSPYTLQVANHIFNLVLLGLPAALGLRPPWEVRWLALPLMPFALAFWLGVFIFSIRRIFRTSLSQGGDSPVSRLRTRFSRTANPAGLSVTPFCKKELPIISGQTYEPRLLLAGVVITLFAGFVLTPFGSDPSGRYFLPLAAVMALFGADTLLYVRQAWGRWTYGLVGLILTFNAWGTLESALRIPPGLTTQFDAQTYIDHRYDPALMQFLLENGEFAGYTTYWVAYPLAFLSQEALIFVPELPYHLDFRHTTRDNRYKPFAERVEAADRAAYITVNHPPLDIHLRDRFTALAVGFKEQKIGDYQVFYGLSRHVLPGEIGLVEMP